MIADILEKNNETNDDRNMELNKYFNFTTESETKADVMSKLYDHIVHFGTTKHILHNTKIACLILVTTQMQKKICDKGYISPKEAFEIFKQLLIKYSVQRPPFSCAIFAFEDLLPITEFILITYFKHYKAYQVAFGLNINASDNVSNLPFTEIEAVIFNEVVENDVNDIDSKKTLQRNDN